MTHQRQARGSGDDEHSAVPMSVVESIFGRLTTPTVRVAMAAALERVSAETPDQAAAAVARDDAAAREQMGIARQQARRRRYERGRPQAYAAARLERLLPQQDPGGSGRGWLGSGHRNALIAGPSGHGKTDLAYAISNEAIMQGLWVEFWSASDLAQFLSPLPVHARMDEVRSRRQEFTLSWARSCDLLVLDNLGVEELNGFVGDRWRTQLLDILSRREGNPVARTIVTACCGSTADKVTEAERRNARAERVEMVTSRYGAGISTRLRDDCVGIWVEGGCLRKESAWRP